MTSNKELDFWIKNGLNVLFIGEYGVGKTSVVLDAFKRNKLRYKYLSAATLDPWVDLIGVPKEVVDESGMRVLDLVKPREWAHDEIDAIFIDEFNRGHKKVTNAIMELIQFKSINGRPYNNLKVIWAAINPEESKFQENTYNVEPFDAAIKDRFHIHVDVPYKPSLDFLKQKFGGPVAESAINWWNALPDKVKGQVSPRRLDYALDIHFKGGNLKYVLPADSNVKKLMQDLSSVPIKQQLLTLKSAGSIDAAKEWLNNDNNYFSAVEEIFADENFSKFFVPLLPKEKLSAILAGTDLKSKMVRAMSEEHSEIKDIISNIVKAGQNSATSNSLQALQSLSAHDWVFNNVNPYSYKFKPHYTGGDSFSKIIREAKRKLGRGIDTSARKSALKHIMDNTGPQDTLNNSDAIDALKICEIFYERSQIGTINKIGPELIRYINFLLVYLINNGSDVDALGKKLKNIFRLLRLNKDFLLKPRW